MFTNFSRRNVLKTLACAAGALSLNDAARALALTDPSEEGWTSPWDEALLAAELERFGKSYDEAEHMIRGHRGPEYNYATNVRSMDIHPTRDSLEYASLLLYSRNSAMISRALEILQRVLPLQVREPSSPYFGLWSYYLEEPAEMMHSADFNWADFNGSSLLNILLVHEKSLPVEVAAQTRSALAGAAASIRKRDVSLYYTNIAVQGTYVTLAAAELLRDKDLLAYAKHRMQRLAAIIDQSGSFAEYNSPTYMAVTIENLSRILMYVNDSGSRSLATRLNALAWKQIGEHWHAPTMQLAGPMSRAYSNDIGSPMWIQKGTGNQVRFLTLEELRAHAPSGESTISTVDFRCPAEYLSLFREQPRHQYREVFIAGTMLVDNLDVSARATPVTPVEGTTLLTPNFALGSANRSDFWVQRRPLIAYWGNSRRPPQCMQMRVIKDEYDFTSALFYSAQNHGSLAASVRFRSDGGDKHPSLDPILNQTFSLSTMRIELLLQQWRVSSLALINGKTVSPQPGAFPATSRVALDAGDVKIIFQAHSPRLLEEGTELRFERQGRDAAVSIYLMKSQEPRTVHWPELIDAGCDFRLWMDDSGASLESLDARFEAMDFASSVVNGAKQIVWKSQHGTLSVSTASGVLPIRKMDEAYDARIDGRPYPITRLDEVR